MVKLITWINENGIISSVIVGVCVIFLKDFIITFIKWIRKLISNNVLHNRNINIFYREIKYFGYWIRVLCKKVKYKDELQRPIKFVMKRNDDNKLFDDVEYIVSIGIIDRHKKVIKGDTKKNVTLAQTRRISKIEEEAWNRYFTSIGRPTLSEQCLQYKTNEVNKLKEQLSKISESISKIRMPKIPPTY